MFPEEIFVSFGFHVKWVNWILLCMSTVTFSALINDQPFGIIKPTQGIRQEDPLSPFLFVLCREMLTSMLNKVEHNGLINGLSFSSQGPSIQHLLFADDSLFLCKAKTEEVSVLMDILAVYGEATCHMINLNKSSMTFGSRIIDELKASLKSITGILNEGGAGTYLGLPECFSSSKIDLLSFIHDRLKTRMSSWVARIISHGGKEVLLKAIALSMSVFAMSCFKISKATCVKLTSAMADFWWNSKDDKKKIHWVSWEKLCLSKELGGLGFKDIEFFNQSLLAKQAWRLVKYPDSLLARFLKNRYFEHGQFLDADEGLRSSYVWRSMLFGRKLLSLGLKKQIGNGKFVKVWSELWIDGEVMRAPLIKNCLIDINLTMNDLIDFRSRGWNLSRLEQLFYPADVISISKMKHVVMKDDFWYWNSIDLVTIRLSLGISWLTKRAKES